MKYLFDTTVISDFTRGVASVLERLKSTLKGEAAISPVTTMEIDYGLKINPLAHVRSSR